MHIKDQFARYAPRTRLHFQNKVRMARLRDLRTTTRRFQSEDPKHKWHTPIEVMFGRDGFFVNVTYRRPTVLSDFWATGDTCHHYFPGVGWLHNGCAPTS